MAPKHGNMAYEKKQSPAFIIIVVVDREYVSRINLQATHYMSTSLSSVLVASLDRPKYTFPLFYTYTLSSPSTNYHDAQNKFHIIQPQVPIE